MDFLSSGLFWLFFALIGAFWFIQEIGYSGRGILTSSLSQLFMAIGGTALTIVTILSFIFMWWQGGVAILVSHFIWVMIAGTMGNLILRRFRGTSIVATDASIRKPQGMNWFQRHLNLTWVFTWLIWIPLNYSDDAIPPIIGAIFLLVVSGWVIKQKGRSLWWILLTPFFSSLWLKNKKKKPEPLNDLYELEQKLEQIPDKEEEDEDEEVAEEKDSLIKNMSTEDLLAIKKKYPDNQSVQTLIDSILEKRGKATIDKIINIDKSGKKLRAKILVVDDDERYLEFVSNQLIAEGYKVDTSVDGIDALAKIKGNKYNILLTGIRMPMSGFELYKQVCKINPQLANKTIVVSGSVNDEDTRQFLADNKLPYMPKPFMIEQLINEVNRKLT